MNTVDTIATFHCCHHLRVFKKKNNKQRIIIIILDRTKIHLLFRMRKTKEKKKNKIVLSRERNWTDDSRRQLDSCQTRAKISTRMESGPTAGNCVNSEYYLLDKLLSVAFAPRAVPRKHDFLIFRLSSSVGQFCRLRFLFDISFQW